ncbi:MAG TPA: hypothetical protein VLM37_02240, partial [Fibrobacteraceae bacterium]|nr:hypothetical protein [Fibrobacteraceae bacterium]
VPRERQGQLSQFLTSLMEALWIYRISGNGRNTYLGFEEFSEKISMTIQPWTENTALTWRSHGSQLPWHLVRFCALIFRGQVKLTSSGELHRRNLGTLDAELVSTAQVAESAPVDERILLMQFMVEQGWFRLVDGNLCLKSVAWESLNRNSGRLRHSLCKWWLQRRLGVDSSQLRQIMRRWPEITDAGSLARCFWPFTPSQRIPVTGEQTWNALPRALREMWLMGLLDFGMKQGRIIAIRISMDGGHWLRQGFWPQEADAPPAPRSTANFESILSLRSPLHLLFVAANITELLNDEEFVRVQYVKTRLLTALRSGLPEAWLEEYLQWAHLPEPVLATIREWCTVHFGSSLRINSVTLWIQDEVRRKELSEFPQFLTHVEQVIPGWGFLLKASHVKQAREILAQFGLEPPVPEEHGEGVEISARLWDKDFGPQIKIQGTPDYDIRPPEAHVALASAMVGQSKYTTEFQILDQPQMLKVLRYAMVMEIPVEVVIKNVAPPKGDPVSRICTITRINNRREPFRVHSLDADGAPWEFGLDQVIKLRLTAL